MRASRETELAQTHPLHVVTAWIGNSARIAVKHYLQVTDSDFVKTAELKPLVAKTAYTERALEDDSQPVEQPKPAVVSPRVQKESIKRPTPVLLEDDAPNDAASG